MVMKRMKPGSPLSGDQQPENVETLRAYLAARTKEIAQQKILAIVPLWKQNNLTARGLELSMIKTPTAAQQAEQAAITAIWDQTKAIRAASDQIEDELEDMTAAELKAVSLETHGRWPA